MIRPLHSCEVPLMYTAALSFAAEGAIPGGLKVPVFDATWRGLIDSEIGVVLAMFSRHDKLQGAIGAVKYPDPFNGDLCAVENFWFMLPEFRSRGGLLFRAFERWAREQGCKRVSMIHLQKLQPERLKEFYLSHEYDHIESAYVKTLA